VADLQAQVGPDRICIRGVCFRGDGAGLLFIENEDRSRRVATFNVKGTAGDTVTIHPLVEAFDSFYYYFNRNGAFGSYNNAARSHVVTIADKKLCLAGNMCIVSDGDGRLFVEDMAGKRAVSISLNSNDSDRLKVFMDGNNAAPYAFVNGPKRTMGVYTNDTTVTSISDKGVCMGSEKTCLVVESAKYIWVQDYAGTMKTMRVAASDARDMLRIYSSATATSGERRFYYFNNNGDSSWTVGL
jgi:hypothetical protein